MLRLLAGAKAWRERKGVLADQVKALLLQVILKDDCRGYYEDGELDTCLKIKDHILCQN